MASSSTVPVKRKRTFGTEISEALTCPVCLDLFTQPVILPACGHTLCFTCAEKLIPSVNKEGKFLLPCPECRTESTLSKKPLVDRAELKTNYSVQCSVDCVRQSMGDSENSTGESWLGESCVHLATEMACCRHCNKRFCKLCFGLHSERLKAELNWIQHNFKHRMRQLPNGLEDFVQVTKQRILDNVSNLRKQIESNIDRIIGSMVKEKKQLLRQLEDYAQSQLNEFDNVVNVASKERILALAGKVRKLNEYGALFPPSAVEITEATKQACELDQSLCDLENSVPVSEIVLSMDLSLNKQLTEKLQQNVTLKLCKRQESKHEIPSEIKNFHELVKAGSTTKVKEILSREHLPEGTKRYMVSHVDVARNSTSPLIDAAIVGSLDLVKLFIEEYGANPNLAGGNPSMPAAFWAAVNDHLHVVQYFVDRDPTLVNMKDSNGLTMLDHALRSKWRSGVSAYLMATKGARVAAQGPLGARAFATAAMMLHPSALEIVRYYAENGVSEHFPNSHILNYAAQGSLESFLYLCGRFPTLANERSTAADQRTPLHMAVISKRLNIVEFIVKNCHPDVNRLDGYGSSPLFMAVSSGDFLIVNLLLAAGADASIRCGTEGETALHKAAGLNRADIASRLLARFPNLLNAKTTAGLTPWQLASQTGKIDVANYLKSRETQIINGKF